MINKKDVLKLEGLMYLYALSKKGSKREVADILNVSVDTVNKYITDLEDEFKVKLLSSNGRGTILTSEGQRLLASAVDLVNVIRHVNNYADDIIHPRGEVRILLTDIAADYLYNHNFLVFWINIRKYDYPCRLVIRRPIGKIPNTIYASHMNRRPRLILWC